MGDIVLLNLIGIKVVLVHGGGPHIKEVLDRVGIESKFIDGLRVTDAETMKIVQMVLAGQVNKDLVSLIGSMGGNAIGLCGLDDRMIRVRKQSDDLGFVGKITSLDVEIIQDNLDKGYIPVIATIGTDKNGQAYNINADTAAAEIAGALNAECMVSMTNIDGVLRDKDDPSSLITDLTLAQADQLKKEGVIAGGMIPKVQCCIDAIQAGVKKVFIVNGMVPHAILIELLTEEGLGTMFVNKYSEAAERLLHEKKEMCELAMDFKAADKEYIVNVYNRMDAVLDHGKGSVLYDVNGKEYIDLSAGIAVNVFGAATTSGKTP